MPDVCSAVLALRRLIYCAWRRVWASPYQVSFCAISPALSSGSSAFTCCMARRSRAAQCSRSESPGAARPRLSRIEASSEAVWRVRSWSFTSVDACEAGPRAGRWRCRRRAPSRRRGVYAQRPFRSDHLPSFRAAGWGFGTSCRRHLCRGVGSVAGGGAVGGGAPAGDGALVAQARPPRTTETSPSCAATAGAGRPLHRPVVARSNGNHRTVVGIGFIAQRLCVAAPELSQ